MEDFEDKMMTHIREDKDHLIWDGFLLKGRYPVYCYRDDKGGSATVRVARYLYTKKFGMFQGNLKLRCGLVRCVAPDHQRGPANARTARERTRRAKAIRSQRVELVRKLASEGFKGREIADNLGLDYSTVSRVINRAREA